MKHLRLFTAISAVFFGPFLMAQSVFINEIHYDNVSTDEGEAIEILGPAGTDLTGWDLVLYNGSNGTVYNTIDLSAESFADQSNGFGTVQISFPPNGIQNGSPDGIALINNGAVVQFLSYEGSLTANGGPADGLTSEDIGVEEPNNADIGTSMQLQGTGTFYSDFTWFSGNLPSSFGEINANQNVGEDGPEPQIIINEVDADQSGTDDAEFVELFDGGFGNTSLDGLVLVLYNGSNDEVYNAIELDDLNTDDDGYFVIGSANVENVDLDVFTTNGIQNGADAVALYNGSAADFPNGSPVTTEGLIDALVYDTNDSDDAELLVLLNDGQEQINEDGNDAKDTYSMQRVPNGSGGFRNTLSYTTIPPTPGSENAEPLPITFIHEVQGPGLSTPIEGQIVVIEGVVVGDFQETTQGFYVQEEDEDIDDNELTSEGVFVYAPGQVDVAEGDLVRVEGEVDEFFDLTQVDNISSIEILSSGNELPSAAEVSLPFSDGDFLERVEGMRVDLPQTLVVTNTFLLGRGGELGLSLGDRLYQPTHVFEPGAMAEDQAIANQLNQIIIDDASTAQNPDPTIFPTGGLSFDNTVRGGDEVSNIHGVLTYAWSGFNLGGNSTNAYRIYVTEDPTFESTNPRPESPEDVGGSFTVACFNVLNYFNGDGLGGGFPAPRGADSAEEFERQRVKIINAIAELDADVVGLVEIENDGYGENSAIQDLIDGLNEAMGPGTYSFVDAGVPQIGTDDIAVGFIYKSANAELNGSSVILDSSVDPTFNDDKNRPALAQNFIDLSTGASVTIAVNHFKSKGSPCDDVGDPNGNDGQGNCNGVRTDAAIALANWLETDPTGSGSENIMIIGDLNAYAQEDPIQALQELGYVDIINELNGPLSYSFQFSGQWGYLDYAMVNEGMMEFVTGVTEWHINADEPVALDYNVEFKSEGQIESFYGTEAFRSSDHDPVLVGLSFEPVVEPVCENFEYYLADILEDGTTNIYEVEFNGTEAALSLKGTSEIEVHIALNEENGMIYAVSKTDGSYRSFDPQTGAFGEVELLDTEVSEIVGAAFNSDGKLLILSQSENAIYSVMPGTNEVSVFDGYLPSLGGDIDFGSDGALYFATREGFGTFYTSVPDESGSDILIGDAPQLVTGIADTDEGNLIFSHRDAMTLEVREYDGTAGTPYDITLNGNPFMTFNGDLASGCADNREQIEVMDGADENTFEAEENNAALSSFPNPTKGFSQAVFVTGQTERASLEVYDMNGRLVRGLFSGIAEGGVEYRIDFDGLSLPNGVYLYRLTTESEIIMNKFMIAK